MFFLILTFRGPVIWPWGHSGPGSGELDLNWPASSATWACEWEGFLPGDTGQDSIASWLFPASWVHFVSAHLQFWQPECTHCFPYIFTFFSCRETVSGPTWLVHPTQTLWPLNEVQPWLLSLEWLPWLCHDLKPKGSVLPIPKLHQQKMWKPNEYIFREENKTGELEAQCSYWPVTTVCF